MRRQAEPDRKDFNKRLAELSDSTEPLMECGGERTPRPGRLPRPRFPRDRV
jgi:hypothetical protein